MDTEQNRNPEPIKPISRADLSPIKALTADQVLGLGQQFIQAEFALRKFTKMTDEDPKRADAADILESLHWETSRRDTLKEVLLMLGQESLLSSIEERLSEIVKEP